MIQKKKLSESYFSNSISNLYNSKRNKKNWMQLFIYAAKNVTYTGDQLKRKQLNK